MRCAVERDFMTHYLIDDLQALRKLADDPAKLKLLNGVEMLLLAAALKRRSALAILSLEARGLEAKDEAVIPSAHEALRCRPSVFLF